MKEQGVAARVYSVNQDKLDEALWGMIKVIAELASPDLKEKAIKRFKYPTARSKEGG